MNKKILHLCLAKFIGCIWFTHKPYDNFKGHKSLFCGVTWKISFFFCHLVYCLHSLGLKFVTLDACYICKKNIMQKILSWIYIFGFKKKYLCMIIYTWKITTTIQFWIIGFFQLNFSCVDFILVNNVKISIYSYGS
jgi:hypothetical protein